jgi:hypothetical protein
MVKTIHKLKDRLGGNLQVFLFPPKGSTNLWIG